MNSIKLTRIKNSLIVAAFPLTVWLIMEIICYLVMGKHVFGTRLDVSNYVRSTGISTCVALALSFNLGNGRFDLSLGAQRLVATIIGGNLAISLGLGSIGVIIMAFTFGMICGTIVGVIFVLTRIPAMVIGIGMALIYEVVAFVGSYSSGLQLYGIAGVESLSNMYLSIVVVLIITISAMLISRFTTFGYYTRAIAGSQKIAHTSGINIFKHAIGCYTLAGGFVSISGVFDAAFKGVMNAELGMTSNTTIMTNTFPMYLGSFLGRWSSQPVGILFGTMTVRMFQTGLSVLKFSATSQSVFTLIAFLLFLIFRSNEHIFAKRRARNARVAMAHDVIRQLNEAKSVA